MGRATPVMTRAQHGSPRSTPGRFASPPITLRRSRARSCTPKTWTLGEFLAAATKHITTALPTPGKKPRRPLNFTPRRGQSATTAISSAAPPTAERRAQVQILRTLGIVGTNQRITAAEMKMYDDMFAAPIPLSVLKAIAALVDRELPADFSTAAAATATARMAGSP